MLLVTEGVHNYEEHMLNCILSICLQKPISPSKVNWGGQTDRHWFVMYRVLAVPRNMLWANDSSDIGNDEWWLHQVCRVELVTYEIYWSTMQDTNIEQMILWGVYKKKKSSTHAILCFHHGTLLEISLRTLTGYPNFSIIVQFILFLHLSIVFPSSCSSL